MIESIKKICKTCKKELALGMFYKHPKKPTHDAICRDCKREANRALKLRNK